MRAGVDVLTTRPSFLAFSGPKLERRLRLSLTALEMALSQESRSSDVVAHNVKDRCVLNMLNSFWKSSRLGFLTFRMIRVTFSRCCIKGKVKISKYTRQSFRLS